MYALITGASNGIGREIAVLLAQKGYNLIIVARSRDKLLALADELTENYGTIVRVRVCDLSLVSECKKLFRSVINYNITVVVNNAGFGKLGFTTELPLSDELGMISTNIMALHILTKLFAKRMKRGHILNVASMASFAPCPTFATYGATKAYVRSFSDAVGYELRRQKKPVFITTLCPGPVDTGFNEVAGCRFTVSSIDAESCAKQALCGMFHRRRTVIPSRDMKFIRFVSRFAPDWVILPIEYLMQKSKK